MSLKIPRQDLGLTIPHYNEFVEAKREKQRKIKEDEEQKERNILAAIEQENLQLYNYFLQKIS